MISILVELLRLGGCRSGQTSRFVISGDPQFDLKIHCKSQLLVHKAGADRHPKNCNYKETYHCGAFGDPFINNITGERLTSSRNVSFVDFPLAFGGISASNSPVLIVIN